MGGVVVFGGTARRIYQVRSLATAQVRSPGTGWAEAVAAPISPNETAATTPTTARMTLRRIDDMADLSRRCELGFCGTEGATPVWRNRTAD